MRFSFTSFAARSQFSPYFFTSGSRQFASSTLSLVIRFFTGGPVSNFLSSSKLMLSASILLGGASGCWRECSMALSMNWLTLERFLSTWEQAVLRLTMPFLWLVLIRFELFFARFPINNNNKKHYIILYFIMRFQKKSSSPLFQRKGPAEQITPIRQIAFSSSLSRTYQACSEDEAEPPQFILYQILLSLVRRQTRKPFQLLKQFLLQDEESSIEVGFKYSKFELEMAEVNIKSVCGLVRQRLLVDAFTTIKNIYVKHLRNGEAYSLHNLAHLAHSIANFQQQYLKWEAFGRLYENYRGSRLLKLNLSKIEAVSDCASKELEDLRPFLSAKREIETINSFVVDHSDESISELGKGRHQERSEIQEIDEEYLEDINRSLKKSSTHYHLSQRQNENQTESKVRVTLRKGRGRGEEGTVRTRKGVESQKIYLIRDYCRKQKSPSRYIKVPIISQNIEIVQIQTRGKKEPRKREQKVEIEIEKQICQNCKFCMAASERKQLMRTIESRFDAVVRGSNISSVDPV